MTKREEIFYVITAVVFFGGFLGVLGLVIFGFFVAWPWYQALGILLVVALMVAGLTANELSGSRARRRVDSPSVGP